MVNSRKWTTLNSLLVLAPVFLGVPYLAYTHHRALPEPLDSLTNPLTNEPQISEAHIISVAKYLSEDIGYRTVGSVEHAESDKWMTSQINGIQSECEHLVKTTGRKLECEVWRQVGSGSHRFDIAGKRLYKTYVNLTNHVIRISDGSAEAKEHAVLVNAHLDSTLPSPGAADDALSVGVMLNCIRVFLASKDWEPKHAIVFLFNGAEESLQDGSHLYSTQHSTASTVRAVINLEAAGTTNRELLFQATSEEMIEAYSHVPRPFGTILASDIFSSGIILSDTDFRQFEQYLDVSGLDMAIVGNSYFYHTRKDLVKYIQPGVAQNMAENVLAILQHLSTSSDSPLPSMAPNTSNPHQGHGNQSFRLRPHTTFFSLFGVFFMYSFKTAKVLYAILALASWGLVRTRFVLPSRRRVSSRQKGKGQDKKSDEAQIDLIKGIKGVLVAIFGSIVMVNLVAGFMILVDRPMSWYKNAITAPLALYSPPAALGALLSQLIFRRPPTEQEYIIALLVLQSFAAIGVQLLEIGSSAMFFINAVALFVPVFIAAHTSHGSNAIGSKGQYSGVSLGIWVYSVGMALPLYTGTLAVMQTLEVFIPLTGRIGASLPTDFLIAFIVFFSSALCVPLFLPLVLRLFGPRRGVAIFVFSALTVLGIGNAMTRENFDPMHMRRLFVLCLEDMDTKSFTLHLGAQDSAPGMDSLAYIVADSFAPEGHSSVSHPKTFEEMDLGWNCVYPFSTVMKPYAMDLLPSLAEGYESPWAKQFTIDVVKDKKTDPEIRELELRINHPGLIWTVLSFEAQIIHWSLDSNPPPELSRHYVREASFHGISSYSLSFTLNSSVTTDLVFDIVGLQEGGLWPSKKDDFLKSTGKYKGAEVSMRVFEKLDTFLDEVTGETVDATLLGVVKGRVVV